MPFFAKASFSNRVSIKITPNGFVDFNCIDSDDDDDDYYVDGDDEGDNDGDGDTQKKLGLPNDSKTDFPFNSVNEVSITSYNTRKLKRIAENKINQKQRKSDPVKFIDLDHTLDYDSYFKPVMDEKLQLCVKGPLANLFFCFKSAISNTSDYVHL